jgi:uncharacterized membrane protein
MSENEEQIKVSKIWPVVSVCGIAVLILSLLGGGYIIYEFGFVEVDTGFGVTGTQADLIGSAIGFATVLLGVIIGVLMIAFSKLGRSVDKIEGVISTID